MNKLFSCLIVANLIGLHCHADVTGRVEPAIHPELKAHTDHFAKKVYKVTDRVYSAVGWNAANIVMIIGDDGLSMVLYMTKPVFNEVLSGNTTIEAAAVNGDMKLTGEPSDLNQFLDYFETPGADPVSLTLH